MRTQYQYRRYAAACFELAGKQLHNPDKIRLLVMAEAWLDMAERISKHPEQQDHRVDHPLVERTLGFVRP